MKRLLYLILLCATVSVAVSSYAQTVESCANGIDDDGDGFIDCFDAECAQKPACTGGYIGNDLNCEAKPSEFPKFSLALESASPNKTAIHLGRIAVGDVDGDGRPEMVTTNQYAKKIFILNGENTAGVNTVQKEITVSYSPSFTDILIADVNGDKCAEIYTISTGNRLRLYDCNLNELKFYDFPGDPGMMGIADFNGDGKAELYARNAILNAETLEVIVAPSKWSEDDWPNGQKDRRPHGGPVAVDILNDATKNAHLLTDAIKDDNLELVAGGIIYSVNIAAKTITEEKSLSNFRRRTDSDATSIADFNLDGSLDVIATGKNTDNGNTTIFFWDVKTGVVQTYSDAMPGNFTIENCQGDDGFSVGEYYKNGWHQGAGRVNIADLDGDGKLNAAFVSGKFLYALKEDMTLLWKITVNEETSGNTGCTLFDFNGDGKSEVVYRDEKFIYIINGTNGQIFTQQPCVSRTNREYPIVADVDADGNTELCVTCRTVDFIQNGNITDPTHADYLKSDKANFCDLNKAENSQVRVFRSGGEPWVPARRVWNQHGYFNVNIADNLTIPKIQQKHHLVFSENVCTDGPNRPLNSFLNQSPFLNSKGCPKYASPDLAFVQNSLTVKTPRCPEKNFDISFKITNLGDVSLSGTVPITFYDGDPRTASGNKLNTISINLSAFSVGTQYTITDAQVQGPGSPFTLYIVLNDNGTTSPLKLPNTNFIECNYDNNILIRAIDPLLAPLTAEKVNDNIKCSPSSTPDNGAVKAFVPNQVLTDYNYYWSIGDVAKPFGSTDHTGATYTGRPDGDYTVFAIHKTANCYSETKTVAVDPVTSTVNVTIVLESPYDNCKNPNAKLRAVVNDVEEDGVENGVGDDPGDYTFTWYQGNDIFGKLVGPGPVQAQLEPLPYTVLVVHKITGCQNIESFTIQDQSVPPAMPTVVKTEALCSVTNSASVTTTVGGVVTGYKFEWSRGGTAKATPDFTGPDHQNLAAGEYTVVAIRNSTQCTSAPVTIEIFQAAPPVVTTSIINHQNSCEPTMPTGSASAAVAGDTLKFDFEWFAGQNTLPANRKATTAIAKRLATGIYTVKATSKATGCAGTAEVTINFAVVTPTLSLASTSHASQCAPYNGSITVAVSPGVVGDYTFSWYNGENVKATADFTEQGNVLSGLSPGKYTVKAIFNDRHCETQPITVTINNTSPTITFTQTGLIRPSDCNDNNGSMAISVSAPGNTLGFTFEWRKGQEPFTTAAISTVTNTSNSTSAAALQTGTYTLIVTNRQNGCSTSQVFNLPFDDAHVLSFQSKINVGDCVPGNDGVIDIDLIPTPGYLETDYRIDVFKGKNDLGPTGTVFASKPGAQNNTETWTGLEPGWYTFVAVTINPAQSTFNCRSVPESVEIIKNTTNPVFTANPSVNNTNCGATGSGQLSVSITNPGDYLFTWFEGTDTSTPLGTNTSGTSAGAIASNLPAGKYTVVVTKNTPGSAGCFSAATYQIYDNLPMLSVANAHISVTDITTCTDPTMGEVTVTNITESPGGPQAAGNYTFEWFTSSGSGPQLIVGETSATLSGLGAGTYYVKATNNVSACSTSEHAEVIILEKTANTVGVDLVSFTVPTNCLRPLDVEGRFEVAGTGTAASNQYDYKWYLGSVVNPGNEVSTTAVANNLAGNLSYTVEVTNTLNGCSIVETYELPLDVQPVRINASASDLTVCFENAKDGSVYAAVSGADRDKYNYDWFIETVKAVADFPGTLIAPTTNLGIGTYIVKVTDQDDATCFVSDTVRIEDSRKYPVATAQPLSPVTLCDPTRPDGVASADVGGDIIYHRFEWFANETPTGTPFFTGSHASGLADNLYSVIATNVVSGCADTTQVAIGTETVPVQLPTIEVLSMVTSCISDNGALSASVDGNTSEYVFDWYIGTALKAVPDFTGETYDTLAVGPYSVTATSRITGCTSPLVTKEIVDDPKYPQFSVTTVPTVCREDSTEPATGFAALFMTNSVDTDSIFWTQNGNLVATGPLASGLDAGIYDVTVISALGCETTKPIEIKTEIRPFNGVSRNNDGQNDIFHINCIESFPSNMVKIFNRAGTMVYQAEGYDNNGTYFDGQSNKGISIMGTELPGGTYFYIIDKRDGSKPVAGYLEIVN